MIFIGAFLTLLDKILGCRDPRCKHEYLHSVEWLKLTKVYELIERSPDGDDGDESDKHIEAPDRFYLFLAFSKNKHMGLLHRLIPWAYSVDEHEAY